MSYNQHTILQPIWRICVFVCSGLFDLFCLPCLCHFIFCPGHIYLEPREMTLGGAKALLANELTLFDMTIYVTLLLVLLFLALL